MIHRRRWYCAQHGEWHDPDKCYICMQDSERLGYGDVRDATRVMEVRSPAGVLFRAQCCDLHPTRDELAAWGIRLDLIGECEITEVKS